MLDPHLIRAIEQTIEYKDTARAKVLLEVLHQLQLPNQFRLEPVHNRAAPENSVIFCFDIDGVLVRGATPIPRASETLLLLQKFGVPFIILINGGGLSEADHISRLETRLFLRLDIRHFVQSHTPFLDLVSLYHDKNVLCLGGEHTQKIREVAHGYGFQRLIRDLLLSEKGQLGTTSKLNGNAALPNHGYQQDGQPGLYFCNPDISWPTGYHDLRFAQGAFKAALKGIWAAETDGKAELVSVTTGKPEVTTFKYTEKAFEKYRYDRFGASVHQNKTVYMIDDNRTSGIKGANNFTHEWHSVLVESGVYIAGTKPEVEPITTKRNVQEAVVWGLEEQGWQVSSGAWMWADQVCQAARSIQAIIDASELLRAFESEGSSTSKNNRDE
ncbi:had superfamily [Phlyctema vagabunda]|uniref:Had superfamily n=1 Tax=Phlyctema vagabunda TaxID=108571 RepID=A0ABR4PY75_9HELO